MLSRHAVPHSRRGSISRHRLAGPRPEAGVFALPTLLSGTEALSRGSQDDLVDPYLTALSYFNAPGELGGARRTVDDEAQGLPICRGEVIQN